MSGRDRMKRKRRIGLVSLLVLLAGAAVVVSALFALRGRDSLSLEEPFYISVNGQILRWEEGERLLHKDGVTYVEWEGIWRDLEEYPIICEEDGSIVVQRSMIWNRTGEDKVKRLDYFGRVSVEGGRSVLSGKGAQESGADGFLYDGKDTYIFLEQAVLTYNGDTVMTVEPLTVVQVNYRNDIHIYGPQMDPVFADLTEEEVTAVFGSKKRIDLATDRYFMANGTWRLLFMPLEQLNPIG